MAKKFAGIKLCWLLFFFILASSADAKKKKYKPHDPEPIETVATAESPHPLRVNVALAYPQVVLSPLIEFFLSRNTSIGFNGLYQRTPIKGDTGSSTHVFLYDIGLRLDWAIAHTMAENGWYASSRVEWAKAALRDVRQFSLSYFDFNSASNFELQTLLLALNFGYRLAFAHSFNLRLGLGGMSIHETPSLTTTLSPITNGEPSGKTLSPAMTTTSTKRLGVEVLVGWSY